MGRDSARYRATSAGIHQFDFLFLSPFVVIGSLLHARQYAAEQAVERRPQPLSHGHEVGLVHRQQGGADVHGGVAQQGEQAGRVEEQLLGQPGNKITAERLSEKYRLGT